VHAFKLCRFVGDQIKNQKSELWIDGAKEYIQYGEALLEEFKHVKADAATSKPLQFGAPPKLDEHSYHRRTSDMDGLPERDFFSP